MFFKNRLLYLIVKMETCSTLEVEADKIKLFENFENTEADLVMAMDCIKA